MSTLRKPSSWYAVLALMSPRHLASILVLSVAVQLNSLGCSRHYRSTRDRPKLRCPKCKVWPVDGKLMLAPVGAVTVPWPLDVGWPVEHLRNSYLFSPPGTSCIRCAARITWPAFFWLWSTLAKDEDRPPQICFWSAVPPPQWSVHDPFDLWYQRPRQNTLSFNAIYTDTEDVLKFIDCWWYSHDDVENC